MVTLNSAWHKFRSVRELWVGLGFAPVSYTHLDVYKRQTLVTKDRVTGHNPAAVLYNLDSYYKRLLDPPKSEEA